MTNKTPLIVVGVIAALVLLSQSLFTLHQVEQALIIQLGKPVRAITEPGLHFKLPFIQTVHTFDKRLLVVDDDAQEVLSSDKKNLKVDNYTRWRINNPLEFFKTVRNEFGAESRLRDIVFSNLREVLGQYTMHEIVAGERANLMQQIRESANKQAKNYGIEIVDVRIKRADLPEENKKAVFRRMQTERQRQAKQYRAEGEEEAVKIRSDADRQKEILLAEAYREAESLRGEGDGEAARIYAETYGKDSSFYEFYRSLEAYRNAMRENNTTVVLQPDGFFRHLKGADAR
ncbi:protease modulator HflC [Magnetofaba australis]|uniref:Protein HflC n=1 Tax=Magnetofaba australis IT-1 TaxID=1434232 RepID=A0A1Y2K4V3_9PROT|nr:protease modulator HflC [Magnetofaba australis]OSM04397.1 putative HflC protein [Magnetofaba australis IT-1]